MGMTIEQRNDQIDQMLVEYKICHDKHFPNKKRPLTDDEWQEAINEMDSIANKYRNTTIVSLSGQICMAFLDDIELTDKKWKEVLSKHEAKV